MQIKHIARIGFTSWRTAQEQRDLAVSPGMLGKIIIDDEASRPLSMNSSPMAQPEYGAIYCIAADSSAADNHHNGMLHRAIMFQDGNGPRHRGFLLADGYIDADQIFPALIDDRIDGDGCFSGLAVANDQFASARARSGIMAVDGD